jgi:elongation factor Ts
MDVKTIQELRKVSGVGMMECKKALEATGGNVDEALRLLREQGMQVAAKKATRQANEGRVESYIHFNGKMGVLVEVNCETDFVARTDDFIGFCKDLAVHIAAIGPEYVSHGDVPEDRLNEEKAILMKQLEESGKPANIQEKIVEGRMTKFYGEVCLLDQLWFHDETLGTVSAVLNSLIGRVGENIIINRFARFNIGA